MGLTLTLAESKRRREREEEGKTTTTTTTKIKFFLSCMFLGVWVCGCFSVGFDTLCASIYFMCVSVVVRRKRREEGRKEIRGADEREQISKNPDVCVF